MHIKPGPGPSLSEAMDAIGRAGASASKATRRKWAAELRQIAAKLAEGAERGPHGLIWPREAMRLRLAATISEAGRGGGEKSLDGKAFGWPPEKERDLERLIRAVGGYRQRDAEPGPLGFDEVHFCRASALIEGDAPASDDEARALKRWQAKWGDSP